MCLVGIAWRAHPHYPLILAGNRDEFHERPSSDADWWPDGSGTFGGRDLLAGGSWLGVNRAGRIAVVTNHPGRPPGPAHDLSRGHLVRDHLSGSAPAGDFLSRVQAQENRFAGFCLIVGNVAGLHGLISPPGLHAARWSLPQGITAISNGPLEARWPKVNYIEAELQQWIAADRPDIETLLSVLGRTEPVGSADLTGHQAAYRIRATPFVLGQDYGTRSSTVLIINAAGTCQFTERRFDAEGQATGESSAQFELVPPAA